VPSGKKSKQQRRNEHAKAPPPVRSKGGARPRQASPRALAIGGGVAALLVVVVVLALVLSGGKSSGLPKNAVAIGSLTNALPGASEVAAEFKGIPQSGTTLGWPSAPVTMVEYIDLQCPICQQFETQVFPNILQKYVRKKKVKVIVKPWAFIGPDSVRGQDATLAAAQQDKAFNFAQVLYDNQGTENTGWLNDQMVYAIAASVPGMKTRQLFAERNSTAVNNAAASVSTDAKVNNVTGTPSIFVGRSGKSPTYVTLSGGTDEASLVKALDAALAG
jgi:protein-disulfide isomerase